MLKTIIIVVLIAGAILASIAFCAYVLKVDFAINIMNTITSPFSSLLSGSKLDFQTIASGASVATAATTAIGWIKSNKDKALAQKQALEQQVENSGLMENYQKLTDTKKELEDQVTDLTQQKDDALTQLESVKKEQDTTKSQLQTAMSQTDALQKINSGTIIDLWQKSGGDFWTDPITGEKYKLMNFERIIVK